MKAKRKYLDEDNELWLAEGEFGQDRRGRWMARPPGCHMSSLENHQVIEHGDGSVSVYPSILVTEGSIRWHGFLKRGVWQTCKEHDDY